MKRLKYSSINYIAKFLNIGSDLAKRTKEITMLTNNQILDYVTQKDHPITSKWLKKGKRSTLRGMIS